jgi:mRNA-degrading endonuclease toxin of MazEF toxin-antitoxin module
LNLLDVGRTCLNAELTTISRRKPTAFICPDRVDPQQIRPFVLVSTAAHPFYGEEYTAIPLTTTSRPMAFEITDEYFVEVGLPRQSYAAPWNIITIEHESISKHIATLSEEAIEGLVDRAIGFSRGDPYLDEWVILSIDSQFSLMIISTF